MDRGRVSGAEKRANHRRKRKKSPPGLRVVERNGFWHLYGTVRATGRSELIRETTGLTATPENWDAANTLRIKRESSFRDVVVHGKRPSIPLAIAAYKYVEHRRELGRPLAPGDHAKIIDVVKALGPSTTLDSITEESWQDLVRRRHANNKPETRERWLNPIVAFLSWCAHKKRRWCELPEFERNKEARKPRHRRARRVAELTPDLVLFLVDHAAPHLKGQIAIEWATGGRVSSVLYGCRVCDYIPIPGREQITFHDTKNGEPVTAAVHPVAAKLMRDYLEWRGDLHDREAPLFVTPRKDARGKRLPYANNERAYGGQNKRAFSGMKQRAIKALRTKAASEAIMLWRAGKRDHAKSLVVEAKAKASLIAQVTQHWFRHLVATLLDTDTAMEQGGWRDHSSVKGYKHDVPERRRERVNAMIDMSFAHEYADGKKTA